MGVICSCTAYNPQPEIDVEPIYITETELLKFLATSEDVKLGQQDELQQLEINHFVDRFYSDETQPVSIHPEDATMVPLQHEPRISETPQLSQHNDPDIPEV